jgi:hypothetical protein
LPFDLSERRRRRNERGEECVRRRNEKARKGRVRRKEEKDLNLRKITKKPKF